MSLNPFATVKEQVDLTPRVADEVKKTTCYMCACRCGIKVYMKNGKVRYIEGNPDHPVNKGVLCAKGSAGIMNHYSPARLTAPLLRVGERGSGEFKEISWEEALNLATDWLQTTRDNNPNKLAFFTGRDQSQSLTGWWAAKYGTRNFAAHGGFCSVNMAAAGLYTLGGAFWEFGEPDWERTKYFMLFGVAEDHDSNPIKIGMGKLKNRDDCKVVSINPVRTGYSAIADDWLAVRPGTDGLLIFSLIHELLKADKIDLAFLARYTNASWLVIDAPQTEKNGLFVRDKEQQPLVFDGKKQAFVTVEESDNPALTGTYELADKTKATPVFELMVKRYLEPQYAAENTAEKIGIEASTIKRIAAELAYAAFEEEITIEQEWVDWRGKKHSTITGRPVSFHAMRGISAHSNGFHTCRALHLLQMILGSVDCPGGWRYKAPYPKEIPPPPKPTAGSEEANQPLNGMPIGNPQSPEDLIVEEDGTPKRIDKAYSWEFPLSSHGLLHMVLHNAWKGDPYPVDVVMMYMANMAWNSSMNVKDTLHYLTDKDEQGNYKIPKFIYSDAYYSETVPYADLILPDTTYLERYDCISLLDRPISNAEGPGDAIRVPIEEPERDVRPFQEVLLELGARLKLPGMVDDSGKALFNGYDDYIINHQRAPGIGPLAGWRLDDEGNLTHGRGNPNPNQIQEYIKNGCFWSEEISLDKQFNKYANQAYLDYAKHMGWIGQSKPIVMQIYSEAMQKFRLSAQGLTEPQPPQEHRERVETYFDPLPIWYEPFEHQLIDKEEYPLQAITQRPMHMYHSWGSQNAWLRQITNRNFLYIHSKVAKTYQLQDEDWIWLISHHGKIKVPIKIMLGTNEDTVWTWNAIGKRRGAWELDENSPEFKQGFLLNHLISELLPHKGNGFHYANSDPVTGQAAWFDLRVRIEKCTAEEQQESDKNVFPLFPPITKKHLETDTKRPLSQFGKTLKGEPGNTSPKEIKEWIGINGTKKLK